MSYYNSTHFTQAKILVVGDVILDRYWFGPTQRISREAPVPVVLIKDTESRPGGAANVAMNIASLNVPIKLISLIGKDEAGTTLQKLLSNNNIKYDFIELDNYITTDKVRVLSRNQQLIRLDFEEDYYTLQCEALLPCLEKNIQDHKVIIFSDYGRGTLNNIADMIKIANQHNVLSVIDPKGDDFERYRGATLLTPNLSEFETIVGYCPDEETIVAKGMQLIEHLELTALLITRSEQGMTLLQKDRPALNLPTHAKEVYDVTGAGDTVISILATALADGRPLEEACYLANIAAGIVVGKLGNATVSTVELENTLRGRSDSGFGIMTEDELVRQIQSAKLSGEKIVMTNGCFDILHPGHVSYLQNARKLGNRLIVAVNSDESVSKLKGPERPINNLASRMTVLASLGAVDWVVPFEENTPQRLISKILPDVLVKGGDYKVEDIPGNQEVWANGGEVKVLNFAEGHSTSNIISKILTCK